MIAGTDDSHARQLLPFLRGLTLEYEEMDDARRHRNVRRVPAAANASGSLHLRDSGQPAPWVQGSRRWARACVRSDGRRPQSIADVERALRAFITRRFPALKDAPVLGAEVCQYENSADGHFIIDGHPAMPDVWIAGGGSGHGYKMGPALGELLARQVRGDASPDPFFALARFTARG